MKNWLSFDKKKYRYRVQLKFLTIFWISLVLFSCKENVNFDTNTLLSSSSELAPSEPVNLSIYIISNTSVRVTWSSGGGTTTSYRLAYQLGFDPPADCNSGIIVNTSSNSVYFSNLVMGKVYGFRVCALNSTGDLDSNGGVTASATPSSYCKDTHLTDTPFANSSSGGDGLSQGTAYKICTAAQLAEIGNNSSYWGKYFLLENNIDLEGVSIAPIGDVGTRFSGTFDGQGYLINKLTLNSPATDYIGLFGHIDSTAIISRVGLKNVSIQGHEYVGGLVGYSQSQALVSQSFVSGSVEGLNYVGGLVGYSYGDIEESYSLGSVTGNIFVAGLNGRLAGNMSNSYSRSTVYTLGASGDSVGGLIGADMSSALIDNVYYVGQVNADGAGAGGLIGKNFNVNISNSFVDASVVDGESGITSLMVGQFFGSPLQISNSYFNINNSCTFGCVYSGAGLQGNGTRGVAVSSSYFYDKSNAPLSDSSWDFTNVWQENIDDYPTLRQVPENY